MKTNLSRLMLLLAILALSVANVFAQEEATTTPNTTTTVILILGGGIVAVAILGGAMWAANKEKDTTSK